VGRAGLARNSSCAPRPAGVSDPSTHFPHSNFSHSPLSLDTAASRAPPPPVVAFQAPPPSVVASRAPPPPVVASRAPLASRAPRSSTASLRVHSLPWPRVPRPRRLTASAGAPRARPPGPRAPPPHWPWPAPERPMASASSRTARRLPAPVVASRAPPEHPTASSATSVPEPRRPAPERPHRRRRTRLLF
jgi:hypothetical protein